MMFTHSAHAQTWIIKNLDYVNTLGKVNGIMNM